MGENCYNGTISEVAIFNHIQLFQKCSVETLRQSSNWCLSEQHVYKEEKIEEHQINRKIKQNGEHNNCELAVGEAAGGTGKEPLHH